MNENEAALIWADEYSRMAEAYDKNVTPYFEPMAHKVVDLADPKPGELFLDLATGTGLLACLLAPRVEPQSVVAIDLADGALSVASFRAGGMGLRTIRFEMMDIRNIVYRGNLFDGAVCSFGIPAVGFRKVFAEVFRVLKPGGRFAFVEWADPTNPARTVFDEAMKRYGTKAPSKRLLEIRAASEFARNHPDYKLLFDAEALGGSLTSAGFHGVRAATEVHEAVFAPPDRYVDLRLSYGLTDREVAEMDGPSRAAFHRDVSAALHDLARDGVLRLRWPVNYVMARKR